MRLMGFHFNVCVSREHMCLSASAVASFALSPFSGFITGLACPASARTSAQLAGFSLLASESQSLLTGRHLHPVFVIGFPRLQSLSTGLHRSFQIHYQTEMMVSVASTSANMDLTAALPALMEGIAQEVGVDMNELKVVLVGGETQLDVKPFQILKERHPQVGWTYKKTTQSHPAPSATQPYVEIQRKGNDSFFQPMLTNWRSIPSDVRPARICMDGDRPVDLYQRGTFGFCLSAIRARALWPTQGIIVSPKALPAIINPVSSRGELTSVLIIQTNGPSLRFRLRLSCTLVHGIQDIPSFIGNMLSNSMRLMRL